MPMGPCDTIGSSSYVFQWAQTKLSAANSCICRWAHAIPSVAAAAYANGPMRYHRQQQLHMPMGPCEGIGSSSYVFQWAQTKLSAENSCICRWAHTKPSVAAAAYATGPMQYHWQKTAAYADGPMRSHRQQQLHIPMGPNEAI